VQADDPKSSTKWQASVSREMIQQSHHIWTTRCNERHAPDTDQPSHTTQEVLAQLEKLYELATANLSQFEFRQLFGQTKEALQQLPTKTLQEWIPPMYHAVRNQIAHSSANVGLQDIRQFFQPRNNQPIINQTPIIAQAHPPHTAPIPTTPHRPSNTPATTENHQLHHLPVRGEEHLREGGPSAPQPTNQTATDTRTLRHRHPTARQADRRGQLTLHSWRVQQPMRTSRQPHT
jgi:hypothetical protein